MAGTNGKSKTDQPRQGVVLDLQLYVDSNADTIIHVTGSRFGVYGGIAVMAGLIATQTNEEFDEVLGHVKSVFTKLSRLENSQGDWVSEFFELLEKEYAVTNGNVVQDVNKEMN